MALHPDFPRSPYAVLDPAIRWFPADEALREKGYDRLLPPLVAALRVKVKEWRDSSYAGASRTSAALLRWWFQTDHPMPDSNGETFLFRYYFAQREAVETIIYLYEIAQVKDKYDLLRFDSSGAVSAGMFEESWLRFVVKMATGSGKTKVLSLLLAWSYFHRMYEDGSRLSRNFLLITPNIIVLDRIRTDFEGLKIFFHDPVLPENGFEGRDWRDDFQTTLHIQDSIGAIRPTGNIFLTNIHRVYESSDTIPSISDVDTADYFLGARPVGATNDSKVDLAAIVRDIDELMVLNDEAHHIHDERLAWFKSIQDIHNRLKLKGSGLSLQLDVTATPKRTNGAIFVQTISDYPLVEAIHQDVVKHPVLPDEASRTKLHENQSTRYAEKYRDYIHLGYLEWKKAYDEHAKMDKKAILFVMTDDTKNCDEVSQYLQSAYPELRDAVLVIHTKNNGEIAESVTSKKEDELQALRKAANSIDSTDSPYKAIVSVLMLKEGWDVRNVTTIVGLRPYAAASNILPEQTLGRGLRRMYRDPAVSELVSVVGTDAFMDFVASIRNEGVELEHRPMGGASKPKTPLVIEVDRDDPKKKIEALDIEVPVLSPRIVRDFRNVSELDVARMETPHLSVRSYGPEELREIVFRDIATGEVSHRTIFDGAGATDGSSVIGYFTHMVMRELRLFSGYDILYGKMKEYLQTRLFDKTVSMNDPETVRNLSEIDAVQAVRDAFVKAINALTVRDRGDAEIREYIKVSRCRPFVVKEQGYVVSAKSVFNRTVGDSGFELEIASCLEQATDIVAYARNYFGVNFKLEYQTSDGNVAAYYPDFLVKASERELYIIEAKGREDVEDAHKIHRLEQWCADANKLKARMWCSFLYIRQDDWDRLERKPRSLAELKQLSNPAALLGKA